ncbi:MAG: hypothetical protein KUA35_04275 [Pseudodesulfovibrio sp.]|uniref:hypothetical protein n=1 Tax=Pseudodesulfovibrio TaxID=2035811 RepID=UPI0012FF2636|nr:MULTISPECIES: hypothetical protein [Pseudodesulfovibrio]MBU4245064.1 hypothetical protein [Pseudomonadota bacterium]MBU4379557.1 hypothetical protein [Pseudomonadota bacterium]MBU4475076.1 hypothetical protein [Pseudomonadota bacterium]MBU4516830.1 hypothetical protein [Pseudomonadota bacterium]MBU4523148.1 hypothetical protein [Pseudomonadota bacterium]
MTALEAWEFRQWFLSFTVGDVINLVFAMATATIAFFTYRTQHSLGELQKSQYRIEKAMFIRNVRLDAAVVMSSMKKYENINLNLVESLLRRGAAMESYVSSDAQKALDAFSKQAHIYNYNQKLDEPGIKKSHKLKKAVESAEEQFALILEIATTGV